MSDDLPNFAFPVELKREAWWNKKRTLSLLEVATAFRTQNVVPPSVLVEAFLDVADVPKHAQEYLVRRALEQHTLETWVDAWTPLPRRLAPAQLEPLRKALGALAQVFRLDSEPIAKRFGLSCPELLTLPLNVLAGRVRAHGSYLPYRMHYADGFHAGATLGAFLEGANNVTPDVTQFVQRLDRELAASLGAARAEAPTRAEGWRGLTGLGAQLLALRETMLAKALPTPRAESAKLELIWDPVSDLLRAESRAVLTCERGPCTEADLHLAGRQRATCARGESPCRFKRATVECVLDTLASDAEDGRTLREHLTKPLWQRSLMLLRDLDVVTAPARKSGWVFRAPLEIEKCWLVPAKKGGGWKATKLTRDEFTDIPAMDAADNLARRLLAVAATYVNYDSSQRADAIAQVLVTLAGRDDVYARVDRGIVPVRVEVAEPCVEVVPSAAGNRLVVRVGSERLASELGATGKGARKLNVDEPLPGHWSIALDPEAALVRVAFWTDAAWNAWRRLESDAIVPPEAMGELAESLMALGERMPVKKDASWLGEPHAPDDAVIVRMGFEGVRGGKVLTVELLVRPVPELGAMHAGVGEEFIPLRRDGQVGHVLRDFLAERERLDALAVELDLGPPSGDDIWRFGDLELGTNVWSAISARARDDAHMTVEWRTKPLVVQRGRRVDSLQLRIAMKRDWLDVKGGLELDGGELPIAELLAALRDKKRFVELGDDSVVEIHETLIKELAPLAALARKGKDGVVQTTYLATSFLDELAHAGAGVTGPPEWLIARRQLAEAATLVVPVPRGLNAELRPYQQDGLVWLARLAHWARGACLADEMGLGKTLQALALLLHRHDEGRALVVAPTSVVPNWIREAKRFTPGAKVVAIARGADLHLLDTDAIIVTSWDLVVRHAERFHAETWATLVLDEAHAMKNSATRRAQVVQALPADFVLALTGTPVENRPSELWSLFQSVAPGLLGSAEAFRDNFAQPIAGGDDDAVRRLARLVRPFILRRTKGNVATDLPDKSEVRVDVVLSAAERDNYEKVRRSAMAQIARDEASPELSAGQRIFKVLVVLTRLRQLACHPRLVDPKAGPMSTKLERLLDLMSALRDEGRKVLVFSQFTELLALVRAAFDEAGFTYAYLDGQTPAERRMSEVDRFQSGATDAFLLSLKAGGVGLNLTAASEVIHLDPWWNPAVEDQATGRAHRIGQERPVTVYRLVALGTVEEQILALHADKRTMVAGLLDGTGSSAALTADELMALLSEEGLDADIPDAASDVRAPAPPPKCIDFNATPAHAPTKKPPAKAVVAAAAPDDGPLERVLALLEKTRSAMRRGELVVAATLDEPAWQIVRAGLEQDGRVEVSGQSRGRSYRWIGPS